MKLFRCHATHRTGDQRWCPTDGVAGMEGQELHSWEVGGSVFIHTYMSGCTCVSLYCRVLSVLIKFGQGAGFNSLLLGVWFRDIDAGNFFTQLVLLYIYVHVCVPTGCVCARWFSSKYSCWSGAADDSHNYRLSCPTAEEERGVCECGCVTAS